MRDDDPLAPPEDDSEQRREQESSTESADSDSGSNEQAGSTESTDSGSGSSEQADSGSGSLQKGEFTAPSVGPHTVIDRTPPEERLDFDKISNEDAMGRDKRREVVGGKYGPSRTRVFGTFAAFFAVVAVIAGGFYFLTKELDQPPEENADVAPWSASDAPQTAPRPLQ